MMKILFLSAILIITNYVNSSCFDSAKPKPHIIIWLTDDMGYNDVGYHGSNHLSTPNIDSMAADGVIFKTFYAQPLCSASRAALMTGRYPLYTGMQNYVIRAGAPWGLPLNNKIMPEYLKDYGYATHTIGKWHLGFFRKDYTPTQRGFDSHTGFWTEREDFFNHSCLSDNLPIGYDFRTNERLLDRSETVGKYSTDYFKDKAMKIIEEHNTDKPLFLYMAMQNPHAANIYDPIQAPQDLIDKFGYINDTRRRKFAANMKSLDNAYGDIFKSLFKKNMLDNCIIIFFSDNGGDISGFMPNAGSNYPLKGTKGTLREGGISVPGFIWSPRLKKKVYKSPVHITDILPTIMEMIDENSPTLKNKTIDGISIWKSLLHGKTPERRDILLNVDPVWNMSAIRDCNWKLIQGVPPSNIVPLPEDYSTSYEYVISSDDSAIILEKIKADRLKCEVHDILRKINRNPDFEMFKKLRIDCGTIDQSMSNQCNLINNQTCLYRINRDPCEYHNVAAEYPEIVEKMMKKIKKLNETAVPAFGTLLTDPNANPDLHGGNWVSWIQ